METNKNLEIFLNLITEKESGWLEKTQWRKANEDWLKKSSAVALKVLQALREKNMSQKELATLMQVTPQHINTILKGQENLSLGTITKLEKALEIRIIEVKISILI
jgi:ribosome-binding protein aMBF1 (putative translation factor)